MPLGIRPTVDFAFKKIFGSPENVQALMGLLNAILDLQHPVKSVEILNPFSYQEFAKSKLIVLDVRCRDARGQLLNVEMQVASHPGLIERLVYYACNMYQEQVTRGEDYDALHRSISICLLDDMLFDDSSQAHHRFQLVDLASGRALENAIEIHTVELRKYNLEEATIAGASKLEQWVFLLLRAQDYEASELRRLLPGIEFETAIRTIETISGKTEDKQMYDQREKAQRDHEWALSSARKQGREEGREEGREAGREEGELIGKVRLLEELLGERPTTSATLAELGRHALAARLADLQQRLRDRPA